MAEVQIRFGAVDSLCFLFGGGVGGGGEMPFGWVSRRNTTDTTIYFYFLGGVLFFSNPHANGCFQGEPNGKHTFWIFDFETNPSLGPFPLELVWSPYEVPSKYFHVSIAHQGRGPTYDKMGLTL